MKIIYLADIRGSLSMVFSLLNETVADIYLISGEILAMPFYSVAQSMEFYGLREDILRVMEKQESPEEPVDAFARRIIYDPDINPDIQGLVRRYMDISTTAYETMNRKYRILERIFTIKSGSSIYLIPGESDIQLDHTLLASRDIHMKTAQSGSLTIAGIGSPGLTASSALPDPHLLTDFLRSASPDIILSNSPGRVISGTAHPEKDTKSPQLREYCALSDVVLCAGCSIHKEWGLSYVNGTLFLDPPGFGENLDSSPQAPEGGCFFELDLDEGNIPSVRLMKLAGRRVHTIAEYRLSDRCYLENIIDRKRYSAINNKVNVDNTGGLYMQIPELRTIRDIRNFFRIYQTEQTDDRIRNLEEALSVPGGMSGNYAMDVVGSINMGMAQDLSDADVVLYIRGIDECPEHDIDEWEPARKAVNAIREFLSEKHGFEVIDYINLDVVERSIRENRHECDSSQRFAAYRSFCRPVNYRVIAPVEDMLNQDIGFRKIVEKNIAAYLRVLARTPDVRKSFDKYMTRLKSSGVRIPEPILSRIRTLLQLR